MRDKAFNTGTYLYIKNFSVPDFQVFPDRRLKVIEKVTQIILVTYIYLETVTKFVVKLHRVKSNLFYCKVII